MRSLQRVLCFIGIIAMAGALSGPPAAAAGNGDGGGEGGGESGGGDPAARAETTNPQPPDSVVYAIYSTLINQHYETGTQQRLIILRESVDAPEDTEIDNHYRVVLGSALEPIPSEVVESYRSSAPDRMMLAPAFRLRRPYQLASQACLDSVFSFCPGGWDVFAGRFPGTRGYITLSRVTLDSGGTEALVYTENHCGMWCAEGTFVYLRKESEEWRVVRKLTAWVS